jgi:hypothetical protein
MSLNTKKSLFKYNNIQEFYKLNYKNLTIFTYSSHLTYHR